jgi:dipeptidyl aminopeptidase/acylaminoacyl peptidase
MSMSFTEANNKKKKQLHTLSRVQTLPIASRVQVEGEKPENVAKMLKASPIVHISAKNPPTLIILGDSDMYCSCGYV